MIPESTAFFHSRHAFENVFCKMLAILYLLQCVAKKIVKWWFICSFSSLPASDILHHSRVPTDHFQKSLPRLPIPDLEKTAQRYLAAQTPLLTAEELANTTKLVEDFKNGPGKGKFLAYGHVLLFLKLMAYRARGGPELRALYPRKFIGALVESQWA